MLWRYSICFAILAVGWTAGLPAQAKSIRVLIDNLVFSPASVSARVGDTIEWTNRDAVAHTATAAGAWDIQIAAGKSARLAVRKPGSFNYFCRFHPNMTGRVTVSAK